MTGFGSASSHEDGMTLHVEIRSVNNKFYKANIRSPESLQGLDAEIDSKVSSYINRGSISVAIKFTDASEDAAASINSEAMRSYIDQIRSIDDSIQIDAGRLLSLPGVIMQDAGDVLATRVKTALLSLVDTACEQLIEMRCNEGKALKQDLDEQIKKITTLLSFIKQRAPEIVADYQARLKQRMETLLSEIGKNVSQEDLLREVAVFAERTDISEEIKRLAGHLEQFTDLSSRLDGEPIGRTLDFLSQEMLREANTIASKCLDSETSKRIVEIKGSIDRIKEQVQNAE